MTTTHRLTSLALVTLFLLPASGFAQTTTEQERHDRAKASQSAHDSRHHTPAKVIGGSAAGGAVVGGLLGGGKGAVIGAGVGAGGGVVANNVRTDKGIKAREQRQPN